MEDPSEAGGSPITVAIVDDEALVRTGFTHILNAAPDIRVVAATDGEGAVAAIGEAAPDVVLLDIRMPGKNGLEVLAEIAREPNHPVIAMLTTFDTDEHIATALQSGAAGFLVKDTDPTQLPQLIRTLYGGGVVFSPVVSTTVISGYLGRDAGSEERALEGLTNRERAVLILLSEGQTNTEIGEALYLSVGTVKSHVSSILSKLGVKSRVEAALLAERAGLLRK
ncbi:MAG: response regulator transcription factor [Solirubrobacterales bacterium]|nr:response regulator transcription factor [Solirubrobacterales bacterium]